MNRVGITKLSDAMVFLRRYINVKLKSICQCYFHLLKRQ